MPITVIDLLSSSPTTAGSVPPLPPRQSDPSTLGEDHKSAAEDEDDDVDDDDIVDIDEVKHKLKGVLKNVKSHGSFVTSDKIVGNVQTGLTVNNVGPIALPLAPKQAKQIIAQSHRAPFGRGSETVVDENVRKTWELNVDQFSLKDPSWPATLTKIAAKVQRELGCPRKAKVKASLYKLLLYEEGAHFKPHKDTEKEPNMFGTLVICLPSEYTGGELVATHCGRRKVIELAWPAECHVYTAWYSDVTHEVKPIKSGYRLALVYNLVQTMTGTTSASSFPLQAKDALGDILHSWDLGVKRDVTMASDTLIYRLDHQYSNASISFDTLKGQDRIKAKYLKEFCAANNICLYLASMQRTKEGGCEDEDYYPYRYNRYGCDEEDECDEDEENSDEDEQNSDEDENDEGSEEGDGAGEDDVDVDVEDEVEEDDSDEEEEDEDESSETRGMDGDYHKIIEVTNDSLSLTRLVDLDGQLLAEDVQIDREQIVQGANYGKREPDDEEYSGWTGNEGTSATHWYRDTVIVLTPLGSRRDFLLKSLQDRQVDINQWLKRLIKKVSNESVDQFTKKDLRELAYTLLHVPGRATRDRFHWMSTYKQESEKPEPALILAFRVSFVLQDRSLFEKAIKMIPKIDPTQFDDIGKAIYYHNIEPEHTEIKRLINALTTFHDRVQAIQHIQSAFDRKAIERPALEGKRQRVQVWARSESTRALGSLHSVTGEDGRYLVTLATVQPSVVPLDECVSIASKYGSNTGFLVAMGTNIAAARVAGDLDEAASQVAFRAILNLILTRFHIETRKSTKRTQAGMFKTTHEEISHCLLSGSDIGTLLHQLHVKNLADDRANLLDKLTRAADICDVSAFEAFYFPLFHTLQRQITATPTLEAIYAPLYHLVLTVFLQRYVQFEPPPGNLARPPAGCQGRMFNGRYRCPDCPELDAFLVDPRQKIWRFPVSKDRRQHLHNQLQRSGCSHESSDYGRCRSLVVTKGMDAASARQEEWGIRCKKAQDLIHKLNQQVLKRLLGTEYDAIRHCQQMRRSVSNGGM